METDNFAVLTLMLKSASTMNDKNISYFEEVLQKVRESTECFRGSSCDVQKQFVHHLIACTKFVLKDFSSNEKLVMGYVMEALAKFIAFLLENRHEEQLLLFS